MNLGDLLDKLTIVCHCGELTVSQQLRKFFPQFVFMNTDLYHYIYEESDERVTRTLRNYCSALKTGNWKTVPQKLFSTIFSNIEMEIKLQCGFYRMYSFTERLLPEDARERAEIEKSLRYACESKFNYIGYELHTLPEILTWALISFLLDGYEAENSGNIGSAETLFRLHENQEYWSLEDFLIKEKDKFLKTKRGLRVILIILSAIVIFASGIAMFRINNGMLMFCFVGIILLLLLHVLNYNVNESTETLKIFEREYRNNAAVRGYMRNQVFLPLSYTIVPYGLTAAHSVTWYGKRRTGIILFVMLAIMILLLSIMVNNYPFFIGGMALLTMITILQDSYFENCSLSKALSNNEGKTLKEIFCEDRGNIILLNGREDENLQVLRRVYSSEFARLKNMRECIVAFSLIIVASFGLIAISMDSGISSYFHIFNLYFFYLLELLAGIFVIFITLLLLASDDWFFECLMNLAYDSNYRKDLNFNSIQTDLQIGNMQSLFREYRMLFKGPRYISRIAFVRGIYDYCYFKIVQEHVRINEIDKNLRPKSFYKNIIRTNRAIIVILCLLVMSFSMLWGLLS